MRHVRVTVEPHPYDVLIEAGLLRRAGSTLARLFGGRRRCFVITVPRVQKLWGPALKRSLAEAGMDVACLAMPEGERHKTLSTVERLCSELVRLGADRASLVIAFGGGVVGDVGGLTASLYMRGVDFVQIPTTLLAQVDASVGGKTGVNLKAGKNLVGTFHQPRMVLIDPKLLGSLPKREFRAGLYEVVKCGVIGDVALFNLMDLHAKTVLDQDEDMLTQVIASSVKLKAEVVSADEKENGLRRILNFGHTIGHALEAETEYGHFLHGEAVAWGMIAATHIAVAQGVLQAQVAERVVRVVRALGPLPEVGVAPSKIVKRLLADKKTVLGSVHFVLPKEIGKVDVVPDVPAAVVTSAIEELRRLSRK
jgi:3-dehydroquinate synthase